MNNFKNLIYEAISPINKSYIGFTSKGLNRRRKEHIWDAKRHKYNIKFHQALRKYNFNFKWKIICYCKTREEAEKQEKYFINLYNSYYEGYNSTFGGDGFSGGVGLKEKISNALNKYHSKPNTRLKHSRERGGQAILVYKAICIQKARGFEERRKAIYERGELVGEFKTQIDACEKLNLSPSKVCNCLKNLRKTHKGYIFQFKD